MTAPVELLSAFACEDVRLEFNGQMTFVGTVSSRFGVETFPSTTPLHVITFAKVSGIARTEFEFQIVLNEKEVLTTGSVEFEATTEDDGAIFPLGASLGPFPSAGEVALNWRLKGEDIWRRLKVWHIEHIKRPPETDAPSV